MTTWWLTRKKERDPVICLFSFSTRKMVQFIPFIQFTASLSEQYAATIHVKNYQFVSLWYHFSSFYLLLEETLLYVLKWMSCHCCWHRDLFGWMWKLTLSHFPSFYNAAFQSFAMRFKPLNYTAIQFQNDFTTAWAQRKPVWKNQNLLSLLQIPET